MEITARRKGQLRRSRMAHSSALHRKNVRADSQFMKSRPFSGFHASLKPSSSTEMISNAENAMLNSRAAKVNKMAAGTMAMMGNRKGTTVAIAFFVLLSLSWNAPYLRM